MWIVFLHPEVFIESLGGAQLSGPVLASKELMWDGKLGSLRPVCRPSPGSVRGSAAKITMVPILSRSTL